MYSEVIDYFASEFLRLAFAFEHQQGSTQLRSLRLAQRLRFLESLNYRNYYTFTKLETSVVFLNESFDGELKKFVMKHFKTGL